MNKTVLDLKGLKCPLPVLKVQKAMKSLNNGDALEVHATDPLSVIDIPAYCQESGHQLVKTDAEGDIHIFHLQCVAP